MSRYHGLKTRRYNMKSGYMAKNDLYRILQKYLKRYRSPKYQRSKYQRRGRERSGSRSKYNPRMQPRTPTPRYKKMPKLNLSAIREPHIRYLQERHTTQSEIDTDQLATTIENRLNGKLTKVLLEKLEAEIQELQEKINSKEINENLETAEEDEKTEVAKKDTELTEDREALESQTETGTETSQEAEMNSEQVSEQMIEEPLDVDTNQLEEDTETLDEAEPLEGHIIDEEWIDEDGLNTFFRSEIIPQLEQEAEVTNEPIESEPVVEVTSIEAVPDTELFPPEVEVIEPEPEPIVES